jgi:hypothetical protein
VPLIAVSAARSKMGRSDMAVSRRVMFHSAALFGSALYLLAMGSAGYYLRYFGGSWGTVMQVTFLFGALALLAGILFSGTFRSWLKVFISKHFYSYNYDYREEWLRFTRTLSEQGAGTGRARDPGDGRAGRKPGRRAVAARDSQATKPATRSGICRMRPAAEPADSPSASSWKQPSGWSTSTNTRTTRKSTTSWPARVAARLDPRGWLVVPLIMHESLFGFVVLQSRAAVSS